MKIILGRYMDGGAWPDAVTHFGDGRTAVGGVKVCGPMGFLSLLKEKLGLPNNSAHGSRRIAVWETLLKKRLASSNAAEPFYAKSFEADSWNTAKRLLQMRDELKEAGVLEDAGSKTDRILRLEQKAEGCQDQFPRLAEMFRLEAEHLRGEAVPGMADSFRLVFDELRFQGENSALRGLLHVELATPERDWQESWKKLFGLLRACGVTVTEHPSSASFAKGSLRKEDIASCPAFNGGEHIDLAAANLPEAAEALAAVLRARLNDGTAGKIVLLRAENSVELDGALTRYGLPGTACRNRSTARPFVQVLPLYLRLQLLPFDPEALRQFLLLPVCPVEAELRRHILHALRYAEFAPAAEKFDSWPSSWKKAFLGDTDAQTKKFKAQMHWICPPQRVEKEPISHSRIVELAGTLEEWATKETQSPQPKTAELCKRLREAATSIRSDLSPLAFEKLLDSVLGEGENSTEKRIPAPWKMLSDPGQIWKELDTADTVVWWDFTDDGTALRHNSAWSNSEKDWLRNKDFLLCDIERERLARDHAMAAPFRFARHIVTVTPHFHGSEESMPHPLRALLPKEKTVRIEAADVLSGKVDSGFFHIHDCDILAPAPAPAPWNDQKKHPLERPKKISPSTLDNVLTCPAQWYFKEVLKLDSDRNELAGNAIACGNLAHEVMERLLREQRDAPVARTEETLLAHINDMIVELAQNKAARLALPEYEILRRSMADRLARSFLALCRCMEEKGLVFLDSEQSYKGMLGSAECSGRYDLMLGRKGSEVPAIVADMKWSRRKAYQEQAEKGRAVQLASYHFLLSEGRKVVGWKDNEPVLAPPAPVHLENAWFFLLPEAQIHEAATPLAEQWKSIEDDWNAICAALDSGRLPLAETGQDSAKKSAEESPCTWCSYKKLCGYTPDSSDGEDEDMEEQV